MAQEVKGFIDHLNGFKRHLKLAVATFAAITALGVGFAYSLPDIYKSEGYILIEEPQIPSEILRSTITSYAAQQLTILSEKILTIPTIISIIEEFDLYAEERESTPLELLAIEARSSILVEPATRASVSESGLPSTRVVGFTISFEDKDPATAKAVADALVEMYLSENLKSRSTLTKDTSSFLQEEVKQLEAEISGLEKNMAKFKEENADRLPSLNSMNMQQMQRVDDQLLQLESQLQALQQTRISVEAQMVGLDATMPTVLQDGTVALSPLDQLKQLQSQLTVYQSRYSDDHPDVKATKRDIEALKARFGLDVNLVQVDQNIAIVKADIASAREKYGPEHPDVLLLNKRLAELERTATETMQKNLEIEVKPDNPAYIQLKAQLNAIDAEEQAVKGTMAKLRAELTDYERRLAETPQVEQELAALSRTLSSTSNRYWVMRDKQFSAEMGETLESESKGEQMILVEPPRLPIKPDKPNRGAIYLLTVLFALVAGIAITQLADSLDKSIHNGATILSLQGSEPLVEIPYIYTAAELEKVARLKKLTLAGVAPLIFCVALVLHFTVLPLDALWYSFASRIGL
jgi:uncharacterized protein involved in exopolysaccharide biosynthesis